jgi:hypothetical protein
MAELDSTALLAALVDVSTKLGEANELARDQRVQMAELKGWVNEQMTVQLGDLAERVAQLEGIANKRRGALKTWGVMGGAVTGLTAAGTFLLDIWRKRHGQ